MSERAFDSVEVAAPGNHSNLADSPRHRSDRYSRSPSPRPRADRSRSRSHSHRRPELSISRSPAPRERPHRERSRSRSPVRRSRHDSLNPGNNLYVTGLSTRVNEKDLEEHFSQEGKVLECRLVLDPRTHESRGFGFVTMEHVEDVERCIKYLNRSTLEGWMITVEKATSGLQSNLTKFDVVALPEVLPPASAMTPVHIQID